MTRFFLCLVGAAALAQQSPVPPLAVPAATDTRTVTRTNANGDLVITTIIPKPRPVWKHYYGVFSGANPEVAYIGEMTDEAFQVWANQGTTIAAGGPQIQRWLVVFSTTNRIEPTLSHARHCP